MSTNSGIFESPSQPQNRQDSPFSVAPEPADTQAAASPIKAAARQDSPFAVVDEGFGSNGEKTGKFPERRKVDSPFQIAEPTEGFGLEAPAQSAPASPFAVAEPAPAAFVDWKEPAAPAPSSPQVPSAFATSEEPPAAPSQPAATPQECPDSQSDSFNIRQLELRAIFGVDRELNADEILQLARALPGMRNLAKLSSQDLATVDAVKNLVLNLGFGTGSLRLSAGSVPIEFIREGSVMLAVQTDGGFAPGIRETLMIVARELGRLA